MKPYLFEESQQLAQPRDRVYGFFSNAANLSRVTPPWLDFEILTPAPITMDVGAIIDYRLRIHGIPIRWRTEITVWEPPIRFVDRQIRGPYQLWVHEHRFEEHDGGTIMTDRVEYLPRGWVLAPLINALFVRRDIRRIFDYRRKTFRDLI
jgi:ligand-binding SRPBCC domain-containing protein